MLADDFFRLAHSDATGQPHLHLRAVGIGLAAALLGELTSARRIEVRGGELVVLDPTPPTDLVAHAVLDVLIAEQGRHPVRIWLDYLSRTARGQVSARLLRSGHLREVTSRRLLRSSVTWLPTDMNEAARPWAALSTRLRTGQRLDYDMACLAGLTLATGLDRFVLETAPPQAFDHLRQVADGLWPPMRDLFAHTQAAIGDAVLARR
ncbi:GPP34 family phosphoprotein [Micromonospora sp. NPDC049523]|uniref:GOLPH3/VPS74 family protein n=1 Tax=Micromonospora sp. NPDC049523 TaxID=3155921 RepID=UPI00342E72FD